MAAKLKTTVSTKGQVVLPKAIREQAGFEVGAKLTVEAGPGRVVLTSAPVFGPSRTVDEVAGMLQWSGPVYTIEQMNEAVDEYFRTEWSPGRE